MSQKSIEKRALIISAIGNFVIGLAGIFVYIVTDLNALLLDGVFSLIAFLSTVAAVFISQNSHRKTATFPNGLYFLEPLYGIIKAIAIIMLLIITSLETSATAFSYFVYGRGQVIETNLILPYTILMVLLCFGLGFYNQAQNRRINHMSTIIAAESKGNFIDGIISAAVGIAIILLAIIPIKSPLGFLHYTADFFITIILVLFSYKEPLSILIASFKELTGSPSQDKLLIRQIEEIFQKHFPEDSDKISLSIYKQGTFITINAFLTETPLPFLQSTIDKKEELLTDLRELYEFIHLDYSF